MDMYTHTPVTLDQFACVTLLTITSPILKNSVLLYFLDFNMVSFCGSSQNRKRACHWLFIVGFHIVSLFIKNFRQFKGISKEKAESAGISMRHSIGGGASLFLSCLVICLVVICKICVWFKFISSIWGMCVELVRKIPDETKFSRNMLVHRTLSVYVKISQVWQIFLWFKEGFSLP